jgi:tetratricopeptide (TPR) repeat protein
VVTTAALLLVLGAAVSLWQAMKAREAAAEASQRAEELRQVVDYLATDIFAGAALGKRGKRSGRSMTVGELLDGADATLAERFRGRPLVEASVRMALSQSYRAVGDPKRAGPHAARAVELRTRYLGPEHPETLAALTEQALGLPDGGGRDRSPWVFATSILERVLAARRRVIGPAHPETLESQVILSDILLGSGRRDEAWVEAEQAEALALRTLSPDHPTTLRVWVVMGDILGSRGDHARAKALLRRAAAGYERLLGPLGKEKIDALSALARELRDDGELQEALRLYSDVVDRTARTYGLPHVNCSGPIYGLIAVLRQQGALTAIRDLCEGWIRELLAMPPDPDQFERHRHSIRLSQFAFTLAMLPETIPFDGELAVRAAEQAAERGNDARDNNWTRLSLVHLRLGHVERAEWAVRGSMKRCKGGDCFDSMAQALMHARRGELAEARTWFDRATQEDGRDNGRPGWGYEQVRDELAALLGVNELPASVVARP